MDVRFETLAPMRVAFVRYVGPYPPEDHGGFHHAWEKLRAWAEPRGLLGPRTNLLSICHDNPHVTPSDRLRTDACIIPDRPFQPEGEIGTQEIPGGEYAVVTHRGPYETLSETFARLYGDWLPQSGREPTEAPGFQVYRNSPENTAPQDLVTDLYVPLQSR
jgi:AraC family transcriptional regulator